MAASCLDLLGQTTMPTIRTAWRMLAAFCRVPRLYRGTKGSPSNKTEAGFNNIWNCRIELQRIELQLSFTASEAMHSFQLRVDGHNDSAPSMHRL